MIENPINLYYAHGLYGKHPNHYMTGPITISTRKCAYHTIEVDFEKIVKKK